MGSLEGNFERNAADSGILGTFWALYLQCLGALVPTGALETLLK